MDPITTVTVVCSCSHLALRAADLTTDLSRLKDKLRNVDRSVSKVIAQVNSIRTTVNSISKWLQRTPSTQTFEVLPEVSSVLTNCTDLIILLVKDVEKIKKTSGAKVKFGMAYTFSEQALVDYQGMLQGQIQALNLLTQFLQL